MRNLKIKQQNGLKSLIEIDWIQYKGFHESRQFLKHEGENKSLFLMRNLSFRVFGIVTPLRIEDLRKHL